ncbi:DNA-directed RNA polymerase II subunit 1, partial [Tanacetum coccineum]
VLAFLIREFDDATVASLNSIIHSNNGMVVSMLKDDNTFIKELFTRLKLPYVGPESKTNLAKKHSCSKMSGQSTYYNGSKEWVRNFLCPISLKLMCDPVIVTSREEAYKFKPTLKIRNPKNRLKKILDACKSKSTCEGGDDIESVNQDGVKTVKKGHGGCGSLQPMITNDGMKMVVGHKLPKNKNYDLQQLPEPTERK